MNVVGVAEVVATLCCGLFAGASVYVSLVEHPARMSCGTKLAATEFGPSYRRAALMQASLAAAGAIAAVVVWLGSANVGWAIGGVLLGAVIPYTLIAILPTNKRLLDAGLDRESEETHRLLVRWGRLHAVRSVMSVAALVIFLWLLTAE